MNPYYDNENSTQKMAFLHTSQIVEWTALLLDPRTPSSSDLIIATVQSVFCHFADSRATIYYLMMHDTSGVYSTYPFFV